MSVLTNRNIGKYHIFGPSHAQTYYRELCFLLQEGYRSLRCHVPAVMIQSFDEGVLTLCPNCWATQLGNIAEEDPRSNWTH